MSNINITITIPEKYKERVENAIYQLADNKLVLSTQYKGKMAEVSFAYEDKKGQEKTDSYIKNTVITVFKSIIDLYETSEDRIRYINDIKSIASPSSNIPSDILT